MKHISKYILSSEGARYRVALEEQLHSSWRLWANADESILLGNSVSVIEYYHHQKGISRYGHLSLHTILLFTPSVLSLYRPLQGVTTPIHIHYPSHPHLDQDSEPRATNRPNLDNFEVFGLHLMAGRFVRGRNSHYQNNEVS